MQYNGCLYENQRFDSNLIFHAIRGKMEQAKKPGKVKILLSQVLKTFPNEFINKLVCLHVIRGGCYPACMFIRVGGVIIKL